MFDFRDSDDHGGKYFSVFCLPPKASVLSRRNLFRSFCFAFATTALVGAGTYSGYQLAFSRYEAASKHLYSDPFGVTAQASGDSVALDIYALPHVIKTIEIDWGDQSEPESVDLAFDEDSYDIPVRVEVPHTYAGVASPVGVRGELKVQFILRRPPDILPEPLTDENRLVTHEMLRLPYGIILDPPAERLDVFAPTGDTTVLSSLELSFADSGFTEPIHFVGRAISSSDAIWLGNADPQLPGIADPRTFAIKIPFEEPFRLSLVSGPAKVAQMDGRTLADYARRHVLWSTSAAPPGAILSPSEGAQVDSLGTVQLLSFGQDFSATVAIRPQAVDVFWVQNDPRVLEGSDPQSITVHYGGTFGDSYEVWAGFSTGVVALSTGDQIARLPQTDAAGGRIWWVGPIIVDHQE